MDDSRLLLFLGERHLEVVVDLAAGRRAHGKLRPHSSLYSCSAASKVRDTAQSITSSFARWTTNR